MKYIILLLFIGSAYKAFNQEPVKIDVPSNSIEDISKKAIKDSVTDKIETEPDFNGGRVAWIHFLERNLNINVPYDKGAPNGTYTVIIEFVVYKDGSIGKLKPLTSFGYGMESEVIRILKKAPKWKPATKKGKVVNSTTKHSVIFVVDRRLLNK